MRRLSVVCAACQSGLASSSASRLFVRILICVMDTELSRKPAVMVVIRDGSFSKPLPTADLLK